ARTATNVKSGGRTPVAGVIHAMTLLVIILLAAPLAKFIPLATLSAVLVNVALHMGEWHNFGRLLKWPRSDAAVFISAFVLTVLAMDATGLNALEDLFERLQSKGKHLILSAPHAQPLFVMDKAGFLDRLGRENVCAHVDASLARARELLGLPPAPPTDPLHEE